jgi:hypothetical protein
MGDQTDPCHTGDAAAELLLGNDYVLRTCVLDSDEAPVSTTNDGTTSLRWTITPLGGGQITATRFVEPPPTETDTGTAIASIEAFRPGNDAITIEMCAPDGTCGTQAGLSAASVQARVVACDGCGAQCDDDLDNDGDGRVDYPDDSGCASADDNDERDGVITLRYDGKDRGGSFKGAVVHTFVRCQRNRAVTLIRVRPGRDNKLASVLSNRRGNWRINRPGSHGKFYVDVARKVVDGFDCSQDWSVTIIVR